MADVVYRLWKNSRASRGWKTACDRPEKVPLGSVYYVAGLLKNPR